jgi:DNA polymerase III delta prime subunit
MKLIGNVHLIAGNESVLPQLLLILRANGFETIGNPDMDIRTYSQFLVDDARQLCDKAMSKSLAGNRRVFIVVAPSLTYEAQNTLLKTLEEPPGDALFFLVVPSPASLLPTVRSRAQEMVLDDTAQGDVSAIKKFLAATPSKRLDTVKLLLERDEDESQSRDLSAIFTFLSALERELSNAMPESRDALEAVYRARKYAGDKGSLLKSLLEQVALLA